MSASHQDSSKWWSRWRRPRETPPPAPDVLVATWKAAWLEGAHAAWGRSQAKNPYVVDLERAAWDAGWKWAGQNPDRRANRPPRLAHPNRRAADSTLPAAIKRAAAFGATGVTVYVISKALRRWSGRSH